MNESSPGWLLPCFPVSPTGDISCSPSLLPRLRGGSLKRCCKEAVRSDPCALSRTMCMWHPGHHCQLHGNFTAGASGVSKTGVCWGFQHSSTLWGQQVGSDTFLKNIFIGKEKKTFSKRSESSHPALVLAWQRQRGCSSSMDTQG